MEEGWRRDGGGMKEGWRRDGAEMEKGLRRDGEKCRVWIEGELRRSGKGGVGGIYFKIMCS